MTEESELEREYLQGGGAEAGAEAEYQQAFERTEDVEDTGEVEEET